MSIRVVATVALIGLFAFGLSAALEDGTRSRGDREAGRQMVNDQRALEQMIGRAAGDPSRAFH